MKNTRIIDLLLGLAMGFYLSPTISLLGITVHWVLIVLMIIVLLEVSRILGNFIWKKLIKAIKNEINNNNNDNNNNNFYS